MEKRVFNVGWGEADITPYGVKVPLQGQNYERLTDEVHDPVFGTVLALESEGTAAILIGVDLSFVNKQVCDELRAAVKELVPEINSQDIMMFAAHDHTAPRLTDEYRPFFVGKIAEAVKQAWESRKRGGYASLLGYCTLGHNRRTVYTDGTGGMYGTTNSAVYDGPEGSEDSTIEMVYFFDEDGKPTGVIANCACPSQAVGGAEYISGDLYGYARTGVWEALGKDFHFLPMISAAGDIAPIDLVRHHPKHNVLKDEYDNVVNLGERLVREVVYCLDKAKKNIEWEAEFGRKTQTLYLPTRKITPTMADKANARRAEILGVIGGPLETGCDYHQHLYREADETLQYYFNQKKCLIYEIQMDTMRFGDCALMTCPFELFLDYGYRIKAMSEAAHTLIAQICNDYAGYLPTKYAMERTHYIGADTCGSDAGDILVWTSVDSINSFFDEKE